MRSFRTAPEAIEQFLGAQIQLRNNCRLQAAMRSSRLPVIKRLTECDFSFQPSGGVVRFWSGIDTLREVRVVRVIRG